MSSDIMFDEMEVHDCPVFQGLDVQDSRFGQALSQPVLARAEVEYADYILTAWWADNGEYATRIYYCPFCGIKLPEHPEDRQDLGKPSPGSTNLGGHLP